MGHNTRESRPPPPKSRPHAPNGCPAQAWSVAEILRAYVMLQGA